MDRSVFWTRVSIVERNSSDSNILPAPKKNNPTPVPTKVQFAEEVFRGRHQEVHIFRCDLFHLLRWWRGWAILPLLVLNLGRWYGRDLFDQKPWCLPPYLLGFPACPVICHLILWRAWIKAASLYVQATAAMFPGQLRSLPRGQHPIVKI